MQDETPAEEGMLEYTEYVDPKYAEKIMAESLSMAEEPAPASPRKGPGFGNRRAGRRAGGHRKRRLR